MYCGVCVILSVRCVLRFVNNGVEVGLDTLKTNLILLNRYIRIKINESQFISNKTYYINIFRFNSGKIRVRSSFLRENHVLEGVGWWFFSEDIYKEPGNTHQTIMDHIYSGEIHIFI